ncbi:sugar transferase, partial [Stenotrophomonas geniculata]|uniref:sugar transferase n=1 Tax=Stenotrophomonas geniculata TaxID=86188 RepID=UPI003D355283
ASASRRKPMICSSEKRFFTSNLLLIEDWTPNRFATQSRGDVASYMKKHMVKAGITGWAQVNGWRGSTDLHKRIECDLFYIENWSLSFDLKIVFLTIFKGFINKNAY